jgi:hypothetical protein
MYGKSAHPARLIVAGDCLTASISENEKLFAGVLGKMEDVASEVEGSGFKGGVQVGGLWTLIRGFYPVSVIFLD